MQDRHLAVQAAHKFHVMLDHDDGAGFGRFDQNVGQISPPDMHADGLPQINVVQNTLDRLADRRMRRHRGEQLR